MVKEVGFEGVVIDMSDSDMALEVEEDDPAMVGEEPNDGGYRGLGEKGAADAEAAGEGKGGGEGGGEGEGAGAAAESGLTKRKKVHEGGGDEFKHLVNYDMNELCARVVVIGRKPL